MTVDTPEPKTLEEISAFAGARRYAEAIAQAAAADDKIKQLTESVANSEYFRNLAEQQLDAATWPTEIGDVIHVGTEPPADNVDALLDICSGQVWVRKLWNGTTDGNSWQRLDKHGDWMSYSWPLEDSGPFLKVKDDWFLVSLQREMRELNDWRKDVDKHFYADPNYLDDNEGKVTYRQSVAVKVINAVTAKDVKYGELLHEKCEVEDKLAVAERALAIYRQREEDAGTCTVCRHAFHGTDSCLNMASDNDCNCKGRIAE